MMGACESTSDSFFLFFGHQKVFFFQALNSLQTRVFDGGWLINPRNLTNLCVCVCVCAREIGRLYLAGVKTSAFRGPTWGFFWRINVFGGFEGGLFGDGRGWDGGWMRGWICGCVGLCGCVGVWECGCVVDGYVGVGVGVDERVCG